MGDIRNSIKALLLEADLLNASDIHIGTNTPPILRINSDLKPLAMEPLSSDETKFLLYQLMTPVQQKILLKEKLVDFAIGYEGIGRFRVHIYFQRGNLVGAIRKLAEKIPALNDLGLPSAVSKLAEMKMGLVLVTGPTGSGKSTTLASIIDVINKNTRQNIITIEDPLEYIHISQKSLINQQELYSDFHSFADALKGALRADPDVILVGEMRDLNTIRTAITAAETGHLVFSTLHTRDATSALTRMIGAFSPEEQLQIKLQLSVSLKAVISQQLLPRADKPRRVLATEVMIVNPAISNLIRLGKQEQIYMAIETGTKLGMQTMEQSLAELYAQGKIDYETAVRSAKSLSLIEERIR